MVSSTAPRKSLALPEAATMLTRSGLDFAAGCAAVAAAMAPARTAVPARVWLSESFINGTPEKWNRSKCDLGPQWRTGELNPGPAGMHLALQHFRSRRGNVAFRSLQAQETRALREPGGRGAPEQQEGRLSAAFCPSNWAV